MKRIDFSNLNDYLAFIETLIKKEITEIIKEPNDEYHLKIEEYWYKIFYSALVGTDFSRGKTLFLLIGYNRQDYEIDYVWQTVDPRVQKIFDTLNDLYIKYLVINNEQVKKASLSLAEFYNSCNSIEKIHESIFIITKGDRKYCIKSGMIFKEEQLQSHLGIWEIDNDKQTLLKKLEGSISVAIMDFLNFAYYVSRTKHFDAINESLLDTIK